MFNICRPQSAPHPALQRIPGEPENWLPLDATEAGVAEQIVELAPGVRNFRRFTSCRQLKATLPLFLDSDCRAGVFDHDEEPAGLKQSASFHQDSQRRNSMVNRGNQESCVERSVWFGNFLVAAGDEPDLCRVSSELLDHPCANATKKTFRQIYGDDFLNVFEL